jgi:hypothetical protein
MEFFGTAITAVTAVAHFIRMISEDHAAWLEERKLDVAVKYGLESRGNYLAFPYTRKGTVVSYKLRDTREIVIGKESRPRKMSTLRLMMGLWACAALSRGAAETLAGSAQWACPETKPTENLKCTVGLRPWPEPSQRRHQ